GVGDRQVGIYVKKVVAGSPAAADGRLAAGDQLLSVNGQSLLGISQEEAADFMARAGTEVRFDVRKGAALRNGLSTWLCQPTTTTLPPGSVPHSHQNQYAPSQSQQQQQLHHGSQASNFSNSHSNYAMLPGYGSQQSVQTTNSSYQRYQPAPGVRTSAFAPVSSGAPVVGVEPNRHFRSVSASDLYQSDPNASYSQRSVAGSTTGVSGFDRLPSHYRHSNRPTVIQPGRPSASSPSALRRGAHSPVSLYRPPSATNLFAAPRSPNPLQQQGYVSAGSRDNLDQYRMALQVGGAHEARVVLAPPRHSGFERELRNLERTNTALMSHDAVNEELDRLDAKGINMTEEETRRYRELLNVASEQSRRAEQRTAAVVAPTTFAVQNSNGDMNRSNANRTETLIDDVDNSPGRSAMRENISPGDSYDRKTVQFKDTVSVKETEILDSPSERQETRVPDGLGFRDKMRIFATQLGEGTPKARYSASSAERQIQNEQ
ncbi:PDZ/DHR/GLGF domain protein, partial [Ostertagia ostertagi]